MMMLSAWIIPEPALYTYTRQTDHDVLCIELSLLRIASDFGEAK